jgi:SAM-dependent methyltransferase
MAECHPASYYHPTGPAGLYFASIPASASPMRVALIGLGSGALACYARPGERWDLFELNPAMASVATDPRLFTFVTNSAAAHKEIVLGDARLSIAEKTDARYNLIVVDAFSSDAIPLHLITREAIASYVDRLAGDGVLLFHISNRFFRLQPVLANVGATAGLSGYAFEDLFIDDASERDGKSASTWMILAREAQGRALSPAWKPVPPGTERVWTDEYSNPLGAMQWNAVR